jgi:hypothetical protein
MTKFFTITILLFTLIACGQTSVKQESDVNKTKTIEGWKTLSENNYAIQYPSNWELNQNGQMGTNFILLSSLENKEDQFRENVNLIIQDLTSRNIDLDKYSEISEGQVKTMITNSNLIESKRIKNGNNEYHQLIYTGDQGVYHLKFEQYYWVENEKAYVLTLTCEQSTFSEYKEIGENILNSFLFTKQ